VVIYLYLEGQKSNDPQPGMLHYDEICLEEKVQKVNERKMG
jgi:hypothetical protein